MNSIPARRSPALALLVVALCLAAQCALATAGLWHHHDAGSARPDDCGVCAAVHMEKSGGVAPPVIVPPPLIEVGVVTLPIVRDPTIAVQRRSPARGPPMA